MVFHIEPVAYVFSFSVNRQLLAGEDIVDDERDELLGEVVGTIIVGAARDGHGHMIGVVIGHNDEVGRGLRRTIRTMWAERCRLGEEAVLAQRAIDLVGGHLMESLAGLPHRIAVGALSCHPSLACGIEQVLCAQNVDRKK